VKERSFSGRDGCGDQTDVVLSDGKAPDGEAGTRGTRFFIAKKKAME